MNAFIKISLFALVITYIATFTIAKKSLTPSELAKINISILTSSAQTEGTDETYGPSQTKDCQQHANSSYKVCVNENSNKCVSTNCTQNQ